ncbi:MAG: phosphatidylserine decarboxylase [Candidatus Binataceae bacterium]|nr:phosphatidylserine decarboxylase [Candidatus Binataceae bacterium]
MPDSSDSVRGPEPAGGLAARAAALCGIAIEGVPYAFGTALAGLILLGFDLPLLAILVLMLAVAVGSFFRDPERAPSSPEDAIISAADGKVTDIGEMALPDGLSEERFRRVSVFMSPLNVHVNRAPTAGAIVAVKHTPGEFRAAYSDAASEHNERNLVLIADRAGRHHAIMQVAGYLARRIVCKVQPQDTVARGQRVGLIMFGSRVDHFIPLDYRVAVRVGDRVRAGESVIGEPQR